MAMVPNCFSSQWEYIPGRSGFLGRRADFRCTLTSAERRPLGLGGVSEIQDATPDVEGIFAGHHLVPKLGDDVSGQQQVPPAGSGSPLRFSLGLPPP
jgi:hypothetical protein